MRISDWSSDVCSSDLVSAATAAGGAQCRPTAWALPMPAARSHCSHHSNREIVAGGNGGAKAVNDTHIMVRRGIVLMRSEEHTSELQSLMRISYAVFCLQKKTASIWYN